MVTDAPSSLVLSPLSRPEWRSPAEALRLVLTGHTLRPAGPVALVVGTLLSGVNEGSVLINGEASDVTFIRIAVNYTVPFVVASIGYLLACRTTPSAS